MQVRHSILLILGIFSGTAGIALANAPLPPSVFKMVQSGTRTGIFSGIVKRSGVVESDFGPGDSTFLVGRDSRCSPDQKSGLANMSSSEARRYVLNHAIKGDLTVSSNANKVVLASYFPEGQPGKRAVIDESHPLTIQTMGPDKVLVKVMSGQLYVGDAMVLEGMTYGGSNGAVLEVDRCGDISSLKK